jgi:hypothetical protein
MPIELQSSHALDTALSWWYISMAAELRYRLLIEFAMASSKSKEHTMSLLAWPLNTKFADLLDESTRCQLSFLSFLHLHWEEPETMTFAIQWPFLSNLGDSACKDLIKMIGAWH